MGIGKYQVGMHKFGWAFHIQLIINYLLVFGNINMPIRVKFLF